MQRFVRSIGWVAAAIVVLAGLVYSFSLGPELRYYDEEEYLKLAQGLVELGRYTLDGTNPTAYRPPGYPSFLAVGLTLGAGVEGLRVLQYLAFGASILLLNRLVTRMAGPLAGAIAAVLAMIYPIFFYAAGTLYPQTVGSTLFLAALWLAGTPHAPPNMGRSALAGLLFGVLILFIPTFVFALGVFGLWLLFSYRQRALKSCAAGLAVAAMVVGSWQIRNYVAMGAPVFTSTNSGVNLLLGNSDETTADSGVNVDLTEYYEATDDMSEVERNRYFTKAALQWMTDNPGRAARLYVAKVLHYFSYRDQLATASESSGARELLMLFSYGPLFLLMLARLIAMRWYPVRHDEWLLIALFFLNALFMGLFFTRLRFRIPMDFLLIGVVSGFVAYLIRKRLPNIAAAAEG